jgi:hypothetical protein
MGSRQQPVYREYRDNSPVFLPLAPSPNAHVFARQVERLEELMGRELANYFQYDAGELPKTILNSEPKSEARAVFAIMVRLSMTIEETVAWISISPAEREAIEVFAGSSAATEACDYRQQILDEFLNLVRKKESKQNASSNFCDDGLRGQYRKSVRVRRAAHLQPRAHIHVPMDN